MIMQGKSSHSIKTILSSKSISVTTDTCDNIWYVNITLIESRTDSAYNEIVYWKKSGFLITNWSSRVRIRWRNDKTCKQLELQIESWNISIRGIDWWLCLVYYFKKPSWIQNQKKTLKQWSDDYCSGKMGH